MFPRTVETYRLPRGGLRNPGLIPPSETGVPFAPVPRDSSPAGYKLRLVSVIRIEDLYDVPPPEIILTGGYFDGYRMRVPDDRDTWLIPVPVPDILAFDSGPTFVELSMNVAVYRWTGSIQDDGTRVFRWTS